MNVLIRIKGSDDELPEPYYFVEILSHILDPFANVEITLEDES